MSRKSGKPARSAQRRQTQRATNTSGAYLSPVTTSYIDQVCCPNEYGGNREINGVPDMGAPSFKFTAKWRGSGTCNTAGFLGVSLAPEAACVSTLTSINVSDPALAVTSLDSGVDIGYSTNSPLTHTTYDGYIRSVASCICITYDGTLLNTAGHYTAVVVPHGTLAGLTEAEALTWARANRTAVRPGHTFMVSTCPQLAGDHVSGYNPWTQNDLLGTASRTGVMVIADPGDKFTIEVHVIGEWSPTFADEAESATSMPGLGSQLRATPPDPVGLSMSNMVMAGMHLSGYQREGSLAHIAKSAASATKDLLLTAASGFGMAAGARAVDHVANRWNRRSSHFGDYEVQSMFEQVMSRAGTGAPRPALTWREPRARTVLTELEAAGEVAEDVGEVALALAKRDAPSRRLQRANHVALTPKR